MQMEYEQYMQFSVQSLLWNSDPASVRLDGDLHTKYFCNTQYQMKIQYIVDGKKDRWYKQLFLVHCQMSRSLVSRTYSFCLKLQSYF